MLHDYKSYFTFKLKEILPSDFEEFKNKINKFNFNLFTPVLSDDFLKLIQNILFINYANSWIRYEEEELFFAALEQRIYNIGPIYEMKIKLIKETIISLNENKENWFSDFEKINEIKTNEQTENKSFNEDYSYNDTSNGSSLNKNAETPTVVNPSEELWDYTNNLNSNETDTNGNGSSERTKSENNSFSGNDERTSNISKINNLPERLEKLNNELSMLFKKLSKNFADLFMQMTL